MVNSGILSRRFLYRETPGNNNTNSQLRSEARYHMGPRTHVPAGISLSTNRLAPFLAERPRSTRNGMPAYACGRGRA